MVLYLLCYPKSKSLVLCSWLIFKIKWQLPALQGHSTKPSLVKCFSVSALAPLPGFPLLFLPQRNLSPLSSEPLKYWYEMHCITNFVEASSSSEWGKFFEFQGTSESPCADLKKMYTSHHRIESMKFWGLGGYKNLEINLPPENSTQVHKVKPHNIPACPRKVIRKFHP